MSLFALDWAGGSAERAFRRRRPGIDDLPWGTLNPADHDPRLVDRARLAWTDGAYTEYATAGQLAALLEGLIRVRAPIDLIGAAGDFVCDEMVHTELHARVLMELGGAAPYEVPDGMLNAAIPDTGLQGVVAAAVRTCCIGESLAVPVLAATQRSSTHPLLAAIFAQLAAEEAPHAQLGWWVLEWAGPRLTDADRAAISLVARSELDTLRKLWDSPTSQVRAGQTSEGWDLEQIHALGWLDSETWVARARAVVADQIAPRLERHGIAT